MVIGYIKRKAKERKEKKKLEQKMRRLEIRGRWAKKRFRQYEKWRTERKEVQKEMAKKYLVERRKRHLRNLIEIRKRYETDPSFRKLIDDALRRKTRKVS